MSDEHLSQAIGRLEGKMDMVLANQAHGLAATKSLEVRVAKLEGYRNTLRGYIAIGTLLVVLAIEAVKAKIKTFFSQ